MLDRPNRGELLAAAEKTLRDEVLPHLSGSTKYKALMVASAVAMARREAEAGYAPAKEILDGYAEFFGQDNVYRAGMDSAERIAALNRDLSTAIREGEYDDNLTGAVHKVLTELVIARLKLSNPGFLESAEYAQPSVC